MDPPAETLSLHGVRGGGCRAARRPLAVYYTPADIMAIIDPASGSGAWLADVVGNPPWGAS